MRTKKIIRSLITGFLVIVFAISITPRIVLHSWFASHKDAAGARSSYGSRQEFANAVFNCNCDNIVAESPFTEPVKEVELYTFKAFSSPQTINVCTFYSVKYFIFGLRGPPLVS